MFACVCASGGDKQRGDGKLCVCVCCHVIAAQNRWSLLLITIVWIHSKGFPSAPGTFQFSQLFSNVSECARSLCECAFSFLMHTVPGEKKVPEMICSCGILWICICGPLEEIEKNPCWICACVVAIAILRPRFRFVAVVTLRGNKITRLQQICDKSESAANYEYNYVSKANYCWTEGQFHLFNNLMKQLWIVHGSGQMGNGTICIYIGSR